MHYLSLEKDFSNIDEVRRAIKDTDFLERIANNARSELIESGKYSFESFIIGFDESLELLAKEKKWEAVGECPDLAESLSLTLSETEEDSPRQGNPIGKLVRKMWKNSPSWIRFLFMVTFFRRNYYAHLYGLKDRYRT